MSYISEQELNEIFSYLLGLPVKEAINMVGHSMTIRVLIREGINEPADNFYKDNRINVEIKDKHIYRIISIG